MDKNNRLLSVVKAFSELDLDPKTIDNVKMGYIFEDLIRRFSENAEAGDHYTGRDIIKLMVNILLAEGCDDIYDDHKEITILDKAVTGLIQGIPQKGLISGLFANSRPMRSYFLPCCRCAECGWVQNLTNWIGSLNFMWVR
jgi:hypothetical protein